MALEARPSADSVAYVNSYCAQNLGDSVYCAVDASKGRVLLAGHDFKQGARIFSEPPLLPVAEAPDNEAFMRVKRLSRQRGFVHAPLWYWSALCSLTAEDLVGCDAAIPPASAEQQAQLLILCRPESEELSPDVEAVASEFWAKSGATRRRALAAKLESLLAIWLLNCFEHSEDPVGFSTFFLPSFLSHSCRPNGMWHYEGESFVLRARQDIRRGEEITVSYLAEEALLESTASRRAQLQATKHFVCCCETCLLPVDRVRGFTCPGCQDGEIFLDVSGDAPSPSLDGACVRCGFLPTSAQVAQLCGQEARVEELVQDWDRRAARAAPDAYLTDAAALRLELNVRSLFSSHHWLRDRVSRHLISYYEATDKVAKALPLATQCVTFAAEAYAGCTALHAWALESLGDLHLRKEGFRVLGAFGFEAPRDMPRERLANLVVEVEPLYGQAAEILQILFGDMHEFYTVMRDKSKALATLGTLHGKKPELILC